MAHKLPNKTQLKKSIREGAIYLLPCEVSGIKNKLTELGVTQKILGQHLGEAMTQSSETDHDNAPADAINHESRILTARAELIIKTLNASKIIDYPKNANAAHIGTVVRVEYPQSDDTEHVFLTGYSRDIDETGLILPEDVSVVTASSPLGFALLESKPGATVSYKVHDRDFSVAIAEIDLATI